VSKRVFGRYPCATARPIQIPITVRVITLGNFGKYFLQMIRNVSQREKISTEKRFVEAIFFPTSTRLRKISLC
jgi:hypothetical protein